MPDNLLAESRQRGLSEVPFEFLNALIRGRRSRLYEGDRLRDLAETGDLNDLAYELFPREGIRTALDLERLLTGACVAEFGSLIRYVSGAYGRLYMGLLSWFQVEALKLLLRLLGREKALDTAERMLPELPEGLALPVASLLESRSVGEFIERITLTRVREAAMAAMPVYKRTGKKAYLEMALDRGRLATVSEALEDLPRAVRGSCLPPVRMEMDANRLLAVLRATRTYGIKWEALSPVLPADHGELNANTLRAIHAHPDGQQVMQALPFLRDRLDSPEQAESPGAVEEVLWAQTVRLAERQYRSELAGPAILVSYYYLKRNELRQLIALVQLVGRDASPREVEERLGLERSPR